MMCKSSQYHVLSETPEYKRGRQQVADWHAECRRIRRADKVMAKIQENREILAWAYERGRKLKEAANAGV